jgi:4-hydroxybenzoate polyprenyltransferase
VNKTIVIALSTVLVGIGVGVDFLAPEWVPLPGWLLSITALIIVFVFNLNLKAQPDPRRVQRTKRSTEKH